ncbi:MAG: glutamate--tRNA ligase [Candidatus Micrarchaeaceae archaeon]
MLSDETRALALKFAVKNAIDYGKASAMPVLNRLLAENPELKAELEDVEKAVAEIVNKVNSMGKGELLEAYAPYKEEFEANEQKKKELTSAPNMELEGAVLGNFAARFPPEPNGYMHIGNAKQAFLSQEFAKKYKGKLFLYFDDTNPDKDTQEFVDAIKRDTQWLGIKFDGEYYASDMIEQIYAYAKQLLEKGNAYVCFCEKETINKNRAEQRECQHRNQTPEENVSYFERMISGAYKEGEAVVRFKGDMHSANTVMRDPALLRIKLHEHYRQGSKYKVWPTYYLNTPINDSVHGVTDAIRSKEYELSDDLYKAVLLALGLRVPRIHDMARLRITGTSTHKRELKELISKGFVSGYDDPRLVTIAALRRRGLLPEAIKRFVLRFGMSKTDSTVSIGMLLAENRKLVDGIAKRLFFVAEPFAIEVAGLKNNEARLRLHPTAELGFRAYSVSSRFYIEKRDAAKLSLGAVFCLKDFACVKVIKISDNMLETSFVEPSREILASAPKLQWLSEGNYMKCRIELIGQLLVNGKYNSNSIVIKHGIVENYALKLQEGEVVNFERMGFFKLDKKEQEEPIFLSL